MRTIDGTELRVNPIGLGAMPLSIAGRPDAERAAGVIRRFIGLGGNFIDTANVYCLDDGDLGHNERLIASVLRELGSAADGVIVATKGGLRRPGGDWTVDGSPEWLRASCEKSLSDLGVDCISLYQLHAVDPRVGLESSLKELVRLRDEGMIRHIGLSNVSLAQIKAALDVAPVAAVQNRCNVFERQDVRNGLVEYCGARGLAYIAHSPVGGHHGHVRLRQSPLLAEMSARYRCSPYALALAWLLAKGEHVLAIPGASRIASVEDSLTASGLRLSVQDLDVLDRMADVP